MKNALPASVSRYSTTPTKSKFIWLFNFRNWLVAFSFFLQIFTPAHAYSPYLFWGYNGAWYGPYASGNTAADTLDSFQGIPTGETSCIAAGERFTKVHWFWLNSPPEDYWAAGTSPNVYSDFISLYGCHTGGSSYDAGAHFYAAAGTVSRYTCESGTVFLHGRCVKPISPIPSIPKPCHASCPSFPSVGKPIYPATGAQFERETDFVSDNRSGLLEISRNYNADPYMADLENTGLFGSRWRTTYEKKLSASWVPISDIKYGYSCWEVVSLPGQASVDVGTQFCTMPDPSPASGLPVTVSVSEDNGSKRYFSRQNLTWVGKADLNDRLTATYNADNSAVIGWTLTSSFGDKIEQYDASGALLSIKARNGASQKLTYSSGTSNDTSMSRVPSTAPICSHVQAGAVISAGKLLCVTDQTMGQLQLEYDILGRVSAVFDPANQVYRYGYDGASGGCTQPDPANIACSANNLTSVTYPDGTSRIYSYNELPLINGGASCPSRTQTVGNGFGTLLNTLTGITDENGRRFATWNYDCMGRALSSEAAGGVDKYALTYTTKFVQTTVTDPLGAVRTYNYSTNLGSVKNTSIVRTAAGAPTASTSLTYDANGNIASSTDFNGVVTTYLYDLTRNLETSRVEASGTAAARTISTKWLTNYRLPASIAEPKLLTTMIYDASGNLLTRKLQATTDANGSQGFTAPVVGSARTWTYTYNQIGQVLTATGPRTDLVDRTTYTYDAAGNMATLTNAVGQVTTFNTYDANGRLTLMTDPNGSTTAMTYASRGWLLTSVVTAAGSSESQTTRFGYDGVGQMTSVTLPNSNTITYRYDDAHRLVQITDTPGNSITYTLDNMGNRTAESVKDPSGVLARAVTRVYDALNRMQQVTGAAQ